MHALRMPPPASLFVPCLLPALQHASDPESGQILTRSVGEAVAMSCMPSGIALVTALVTAQMLAVALELDHRETSDAAFLNAVDRSSGWLLCGVSSALLAS